MKKLANEEKSVATKRRYKIPIESLEEALRRTNFYRTKTTPMAIHYKRADGLHVVLTSRTRKKGKPSRKVKREVGKGKITIMKVHKDDLRAHKAVKLNPTERDKFLSELTSLALKVKIPCDKRESSRHQHTGRVGGRFLSLRLTP